MPFFSTITTGVAWVSDKLDAVGYPRLIHYALFDGSHFVPKGKYCIKNQTPHDPFTKSECGLALLFMKPQENTVLHYSRWWFNKAINCSSKGEGMGREGGMTG